ncbi:hypothetical protein BCV70DRAFT_8265 [Testicularia cyperi]|uniref:Uncharacterized protein n=1 Tax=Testicularia cyperi TaxID=1882483 RepID=A0A317XYQ9_9BASI|nr:hypothetical protein BCV70DRAFT_8265 [Testicularia cyperi]
MRCSEGKSRVSGSCALRLASCACCGGRFIRRACVRVLARYRSRPSAVSPALLQYGQESETNRTRLCSVECRCARPVFQACLFAEPTSLLELGSYQNRMLDPDSHTRGKQGARLTCRRRTDRKSVLISKQLPVRLACPGLPQRGPFRPPRRCWLQGPI